MAYSKAPTNDTYSSVPLPLFQKLPFSASIVNMLPEKDESVPGGVILRTRPAISAEAVGATSGTALCRGLYVWEKDASTTIYFVVVNKVIYTGAPSGSWTSRATFTNETSSPVRFCEFISSSNTKTLIAVDGEEGYVFTGASAGTKITDVDFPTPHVAFPVFLNGRLYLAKANTGDIYCSDLDNAANWTAGAFISSEVYADDIKALVKINNYILAVGGLGCEYFYDAANATGSPLARQEGAVLPFGTSFPDTIAFSPNSMCFLSRSLDGEMTVRYLEGFDHKEIKAPYVISAINDGAAASNPYMVGYFFRYNGRRYYALARDRTERTDGVSERETFVYDFEFDSWIKFNRGANKYIGSAGFEGYYYLSGGIGEKTFPVYFTATGTREDMNTVVAGQAYESAFVGTFTNDAGEDIMPISGTVYTIPYCSRVFTPWLEFGTMNRKFMSRLALSYENTYDQDAISDPTVDETLYTPRVSWNDGFISNNQYIGPKALTSAYYQNYTGAGTGQGYDFPVITQLGSFRKRSFIVECYGDVTYRYVELDINKGQQ